MKKTSWELRLPFRVKCIVFLTPKRNCLNSLYLIEIINLGQNINYKYHAQNLLLFEDLKIYL